MQSADIYEQSINDIGGKPMTLKEYKGQVVLVTNIATKCGYTPQLKGLEDLYQKFKGQGFTVLGIPSNDFGGQTPEAEGEVKKFCKLNYGVTFPLTSKTVVKGNDKHPLVAAIIKASEKNDEIGWNFEKFLINSQGQVVARYPSSVKPMDPTVISKIEGLVKK